ncbi:hypothetical protein A0256_23740 [Mucilaginibacter sp. PAMC 26640]|nr:hypothetical protein A0256_23740 [Mucilaginibacter sp. PAMC 26640]
MLKVDFTNCDREPIHIPGRVQSHGLLISVNADFKITACSDNIREFFPVSMYEVFGKHLSFIVYIMEMLTTLFRAKLTQGLADFWVAANAIKACTKIVI